MMNYKHLLLATDLSADSDAIADRARQIADRSNAKMSVAHVLEHTPIVYGGGEFSVPLDINLEEVLEKRAWAAIRKLSGRIKVPETDQYLENGSIKTALVDLAQRIHVDLIVIGSHGHHGLEHLLGSTANAILHSAQCDVLAVRATT